MAGRGAGHCHLPPAPSASATHLPSPAEPHAPLTAFCLPHLPAFLPFPCPCRDAVVALAASDYVSVRVALAECMAELAALLGQQRVADDLLPVINVRGTCGIRQFGD